MTMITAANAAPNVRPQVAGALALELRADADVARNQLAQADAGGLAALVARDLATLAPAAASLELAMVCAHYDPVEILRPGWPLHCSLQRLAANAPGHAHARVVAFGAHAGQLPEGLQPSAEFVGGALRVVPFVLTGETETVASVGAAFESQLLERGMAAADTALAAQTAFGAQLEHVRYLSLHDLTAMMAMQYEHAGLAPLWPLLEAALLAPASEQWLDTAPEPLALYAHGEARIALFSPAAWQQRYAADVVGDSEGERERLQQRHAHFQARQRQYAAVLGAHGVAVNFVHCDRDADARLALSDAEAAPRPD